MHRGERAFVLLNKFPYASGHLLVAPYRHGANFGDLDESEAVEVHRLAAQGLDALRAVYGPEGFNLGWNVGRIAGAGIVDHGHLHVVPRWAGDTNFMPVLADVRVLPEHLVATRSKLAGCLARRVSRTSTSSCGTSTRRRRTATPARAASLSDVDSSAVPEYAWDVQLPGEDLPHRVTTDYLVSDGEAISVGGREWLIEHVEIIERAGDDDADEPTGIVSVVASFPT